MRYCGVLHIAEMLANAARVAPDTVAATLDDDALTFGEIERRANRIAHGLRGLWVGRGDRVLWWGDTSIDAVPVFAALAKIGAVFAPLNARASVDELAPVAEYARPRLLLCGPAHVEAAAELAARLDVPFSPEVPTGTGDAPVEADLDERDPHVIFFTSGSTGRPKGVVLSHRTNWLRTYVGATTTAGGAGTVCMFPLFHMAGWTIAMGAWQGRRPVHFVRTPDAEVLLHTTVRHRASRLYCIPAVWSRLLDHGVAKFDLSNLEEADTGTSATPPELLRAIKDALPHTRTRVFYGSTEAGPGVQLGDADLFRKPGSVGIAQPGVDVRLADDGEVVMRSPFLMDGYFDDPAATAEALARRLVPHRRSRCVRRRRLPVDRRAGARRDPHRRRDGRAARGRAGAALHPAIGEVAVVGVPDPQWGEVVTAVVVVQAGSSAPDLDALRSYCSGRLAPFKQPRRLAIVDALPRTAATGQVQRTLIVNRLQAPRPPPKKPHQQFAQTG